MQRKWGCVFNVIGAIASFSLLALLFCPNSLFASRVPAQDTLIALAIYVVFTFFFKAIIVCFISASTLKKVRGLREWIHFLCYLVVSPDFAITGLIKDDGRELNHDETLDKEIVSFNLSNLLISFLFSLPIALMHESFFEYPILLALFIVRFLSRFFEIVFSFFFDVIIPSQRRTSLNRGVRVFLALISLLEMLLLGWGYFQSRSNDFFEALFITASTVGGIGETSMSYCLNSVFIMLLRFVSVYVLSFVVVTYLSRRSFYESGPVLIASLDDECFEVEMKRIQPGVYALDVSELNGAACKVFYHSAYYGYSDFGNRDSVRGEMPMDNFSICVEKGYLLFDTKACEKPLTVSKSSALARAIGIIKHKED